jgi:hypothetical protein
MSDIETAGCDATAHETPSPEVALILCRRALAESRSDDPVIAAALCTAMHAIHELANQVDQLQTALETRAVLD